ncbi:MAG: hypothetical protein LBU85_11125 [Treponema sp.]|jgi:hypothetical protein|nr:hypothetical protein [Treponema sp.]
MNNKNHQRNLPVPFFSQRQNKYIWRGLYSKDIIDVTTKRVLYKKGEPTGQEVSLAFGSCNITSLCMILHYFGITSDTSDEMMSKFFDANDGTWWGKGHIAVIRGFTKEGDIIINDPWGAPANPFGHLKTTGNKDIISTDNPGYFYDLFGDYANNRKFVGLGTGDNCIIRRKDFVRILRDGNRKYRARYCFNQKNNR